MRRRLSFLCITFLLLAIASVAFAGAPEISTDDLKAKMDGGNIVVINPLSIIEFNNLHITDSINVPMQELKTKLPADKTIPLAFYCLGRK